MNRAGMFILRETLHFLTSTVAKGKRRETPVKTEACSNPALETPTRCVDIPNNLSAKGLKCCIDLGLRSCDTTSPARTVENALFLSDLPSFLAQENDFPDKEEVAINSCSTWAELKS